MDYARKSIEKIVVPKYGWPNIMLVLYTGMGILRGSAEFRGFWPPGIDPVKRVNSLRNFSFFLGGGRIF